MDDVITFIVAAKEVMRISSEGVISFPEGIPADERAAEVIEVLEKTILKYYCPPLKFGNNEFADPPDTYCFNCKARKHNCVCLSPDFVPAEWEKDWERTNTEGVYRCKRNPNITTAYCCSEHGPYLGLFCPSEKE